MLPDLVIGGISGIVSRTLTAPLELWKLQRQNSFMPGSTLRAVVQMKVFGIYGKVMLLIVLESFPRQQLTIMCIRSVMSL